MSLPQVTVTEIYGSIQGESSYAGWPCTFIRLTGCPLRCRWCDTVYSFQGGNAIGIPDVIAKVDEIGIKLVELTGGEPLAQEGAIPLMQSLIDHDYDVLLETSGSEDISRVPQAVHVIMDVKCPGSGMVEKNMWSNFASLKKTDEIKFVLASRDDYDWAKEVIVKHSLFECATILFSTAFGLLAPKDLAAWMVEDKSRARFQLQQHKYIWHPRAKGV